jgi:hypothetical protein
MKTIVNLGVIGAGGYLTYQNIVKLSKTSNKKDMVIPALIIFISAVAIYHSLPTLLGATKMLSAPELPNANIDVSTTSELENTQPEG